MGLTKASLLLCFIFFLYLHHNFVSVDSRSLRLASVDTSHVSSISKAGDNIDGKTPKLAVFIRKGGKGGGGLSRGIGYKGRGRGGDKRDRLRQNRGGLGGYPFFSGMAYHHAKHSSGSRNVGRTGCGFGWLGLLSVTTGLIFV